MIEFDEYNLELCEDCKADGDDYYTDEHENVKCSCDTCPVLYNDYDD